MVEEKKSPLKKYIAFLVLVVIIIFAFFIARGISNKYLAPEQSNQTINQTVYVANQTNLQVETYKEQNMWSFLTSSVIWLCVAAVLIFLIWMIIKLLQMRQAQGSSREKCIKKAIEVLNVQGYNVAHDQPKQSFRFYGVDEKNNPAWFFTFNKNLEEVSDAIFTVPKYNFVSCVVDGMNLDVMWEGEHRYLDDGRKDLWEQRFGKNSVPNWPGKTENKPTVADLFKSDQKPAINITPEDLTEEDED